MMCDCSRARRNQSTSITNILLFIIHRFTRSNRYSFIKTQARTIMMASVYVSQNRSEKLWLLAVRRQFPTERLTKPFNTINERCVWPVFFWKSLKDFAPTWSTSCKDKRVNDLSISTTISSTYVLSHDHNRLSQNNQLNGTLYSLRFQLNVKIIWFFRYRSGYIIIRLLNF